MAFRLGMKARKIKDTLDILFSGRTAFLLDSEDTTVISARFFNQLEEMIVGHIADYHKKIP